MSGPVAALLQHDHVLRVPVSIGPMIIRIGLLVAVPAVAGFAMLRGFLPDPTRRTVVWVAGLAAAGVLLELMLAGGLDLPAQAVPLLLAGLAAPIFLMLSGDPRFGRVHRLAPWVFAPTGAFALVEFGRAVLGGGNPAVLPTGIVLALMGLSWFALCAPGGRLATVAARIEAALLANAALAGSAYAIVLSLPPSTAPA
jgi:hypothetical protein